MMTTMVVVMSIVPTEDILPREGLPWAVEGGQRAGEDRMKEGEQVQMREARARINRQQ